MESATSASSRSAAQESAELVIDLVSNAPAGLTAATAIPGATVIAPAPAEGVRSSSRFDFDNRTP